jgi:hypothetical protein
MNPYAALGNPYLGNPYLGDTTADDSSSSSSKTNTSSLSSMVASGMPCKFQLTMEFFCSFLFTFIIYFCVFAFFPYDGIIKKILEFIQKITKKFTNFLNNLVPKSVKKKSSKVVPKMVVKFFKETLPKMLKEKKEELTTPLKKKLEKIKKDAEKKLNSQAKKSKKKNNIMEETKLYFNEKAIKIKAKSSELWEKFKDKIIPALIISFVYYVIWLIFFKVIPTILKYLMNVVQQFKQS